MSAGRAALFLDRDGTIIEDAHYLADATLVRLLPGAARAVAAANAAHVPVVIVTNQSGIARGLITPAQYEAVRTRMESLLGAFGARVDATFHCPHSAAGDAPPCECRKPGLGMYRDAERLLGIDLARSAYIGDRWRDVHPALKTGGFGILVPGSETSEDDVTRARAEAHVVGDLESAVDEALRWISHQSFPVASEP